ncbi:unnamed protein product [Brassicogethes aeneus]|uniref:Cytochrome P450 n=1 Tax=Brassicogethes aeneus TaxID=1431903 RepID=A0A9P0B4D0_BRAAE|nr:unnamed protein product [Brassicogethes aeneus]
MLILHLFGVIVIITLTCAFLKWIYDHVRIHYYISKIPGPKGYFLLGNLFDLVHKDERLFRKLRQWGLEFYPIYRAGVCSETSANMVGAEDIEQIISSTQHSSKSEIYRILENWLGTGLLTSAGAKWQHRRKILTPAFHFNILQQFIQVFNGETEKLVETYYKLLEDRQEVSIDVTSTITQFTLCTINETSMGIKLDFHDEENKNYKQAVYEIGQLFLERLLRPWLWRDIFYYFLTKNGLREKKLVKMLHKYTNKVINEKSKKFEPFEVDRDNCYSRRKNMALLDILLNEKFTNGNIDDEGIREEVDTFMFEELIREEMTHVLGDNFSRPSYEELMELKYTERCIKEILRLYPSVPFISRMLSDDMITKSGYKLPKKTIVNIHIFDLHRSPKFWDNPDKFDPDRFLPENVQKRHPFAYLPFSAGPRNCIGQRFAILEFKAVLCGILKNFKFVEIDTPETMDFIPDIVLRPKRGVLVKIVRRN